MSIQHKPLNDDRSYRVVTLPNGLETLLIHDPNTDKAAASLDVHIGYFEDPEDLPGLAHFCEHLLFMGTDKYPSENEYSQYIAQHSGDSNAYTGAEHTNYQFQVSHNHFEGAIDRFAQFFIAPLFLESCQAREVRAVDSENKNNLQNDVWRLQHLTGFLSNPAHPHHKFSTGNIDTLETIPNANNTNVRDRLIQFYETFYSANLMKLVLLGRQDLDTLQDWATQYFLPIQNKNVARPVYTMPRLTPAHLGECVHVQPVKNIRRLILDFPIPDQAQFYNTHPASYLGNVIGHEGEGSLFKYLKDKEWANALTAGSYEVCVGQNKFQVIIELTPAGLEHYTRVIQTVFEYIALVKSRPIQQYIFTEQQTMSEINFRFQQKTGARATTSALARRLHDPCPRERILDYIVLKQYDPELIKQHIDMLSPKTFRAVLVAKDLPVDSFETELYYGTQYHVQKFDPSFLKSLESVALNPSLSLPKPNEFIPTDFHVDKQSGSQQCPVLLRNTSQLRVWHKKDDTFWAPKADIRLYFHAPVAYASPRNSVMAALFFSIFEDSLTTFAYDAEVAGLGYSISSSLHGFTVRAQGYNSKISLLLDHILKRLASFELEKPSFGVWKERLIRSFTNIDHASAHSQADYHTDYLLEEGSFPLNERLEALETVSFDSLAAFSKLLLAQLNLEVLAFGNISKQDALSISENALSVLGPAPLPSSQTVTLRSYLAPPNIFHFNHLAPDGHNVNSCVKAIFQVCKLTEEKPRALLELFATVVHEPVFNILRTREQLGYIVFSGIHLQRTVAGFRISVQSERSTAVLRHRIGKLLVELGSVLEALSDVEFQKYVASLVHKKKEKFQNMGQEAMVLHQHVSSGYYNFRVRDDDIKILETLTKQDLITFYNRYISPASESRSLVYININSPAARPLTQAQVAGTVFASLAAKHNIEIGPAEYAQLAVQAQDAEPAELLALVGDVLQHKGHAAIVPAFLNEAVAEIAELGAVEQTSDGAEIDSAAWFKARAMLTEAPVPYKGLEIYQKDI